MKLTLVVGARPNFMKVASLINATKEFENIQFTLVHTGQHYDKNLNEVFFEDLEIPKPDINLEVGSGSQAFQTAEIMVKFELFLRTHETDFVIVVGDINSSMACAIVAKKMNFRLAHIEAGLESGDREMPEEINRLIIDAIADYYFATTKYAVDNLLKRGISSNKIFLVGNTMIDSLIRSLPKIRPSEHQSKITKEYILLTLHRPSNVDSFEKLNSILKVIEDSTLDNLQIVFPLHPRTLKKISDQYLENDKFVILEPLRYLEFLFLIKNAKLIITDSGGIQEETTYLKKPCLTLRNSTERPETCSQGTNILIGDDYQLIKQHVLEIISGNEKKGSDIEFWDGNTGQRIIKTLKEILDLEKG